MPTSNFRRIVSNCITWTSTTDASKLYSTYVRTAVTMVTVFAIYDRHDAYPVAELVRYNGNPSVYTW